MIKKELVVHIESNEEGEFIKVNALATDPGYFLLSLGVNRIVINGAELVEALNSIDYYATLFNQESIAREQRIKAPPKAMSIAPAPVRATKKSKVAKEDEGAIVLDPIMRLGPTASELALEKQTQHMKGDTIVITEKK
jgi:hypothetical protein